MSVSQQLRAEFWPLGQKTAPCTIARDDSGQIFLGGDIPNVIGRLLIKSKSSRSYNLGDYEVTQGKAKKINDFEYLNDTNQLSEIYLESGKINSISSKRVINLLRRTSGLSLSLVQNELKASALSVELSQGSTANFFMCKLHEHTQLFDSKEIIVGRLVINEVIYVFKTYILDQNSAELALALPKEFARMSRRTLGRENKNLSVSLHLETGARQFKLKNISLIGMCIEDPLLSSVPLWTELKVDLKTSEGLSLTTYAMVVGQSTSGTHFQFGGNGTESKERFYLLHSILNPDIELKEDPEAVWKCLNDFGYFEIMNETIKARTKDHCLGAWEKTKQDIHVLNPVLKVNQSLVGTYGAFRGGLRNWYHHMLAIDFKPESIQRAILLYQAWPHYIASFHDATWVSSWYDPTKIWHNRFCQIFIKEHEGHPECLSFDRHWFLIPDIEKLNISNTESLFSLQDIDTSSSGLLQECHSFLKNRYKNIENAPLLPLRKNIQENSQEHSFIILYKGQFAGIVFFVNNKLDMNPVSISNVAHINIASEEFKKNPITMGNILDLIFKNIKTSVSECRAITLDYDSCVEKIILNGLTYHALGRCLSFSSRLMNNWISNNSLAFVDLIERKHE